MKKAYLVHGWEGNPENCWFPWLKHELEERGYTVFAPAMPDPENPRINTWVGALKKIIKPDQNTILIGHSIGCQTILRYLESIDTKIKFGGVFLVAGFVHLKGLESKEEKDIAKPWLSTPINWEKVRKNSKKFVAFFSDNDVFVPVEDSKIFKEKLNAKIILEHNKGHFDDEATIKEFPSLLKEIIK
ncbi:serine hydrolase family protein [Candidatus Woesearchaeota archaeon]|nr:serine hydrolase family protein [Candidatus Woesearchaeota archaeon]